MGEALWAAVAAAGLGGGSGRKPCRSGHRVGTPAKGALGAWGLGREGGSRMITSLAASRGALTPWAGKEAGAWVGSQRVGCRGPPSAQGELERLGAGGWETVGRPREEGGLPVPSWWAAEGGGRLISDSRAMVLEYWDRTTAECQSWKKADASCRLASLAHVPASLSSPSTPGAVLTARSHLIFTTSPGGTSTCLHLNGRKLRPGARQ